MTLEANTIYLFADEITLEMSDVGTHVSMVVCPGDLLGCNIFVGSQHRHRLSRAVAAFNSAWLEEEGVADMLAQEAIERPAGVAGEAVEKEDAA